MLQISKLYATVAGKSILNGVDMIVPEGEIHVLMGPNGSGKSTLAKAVIGHPDCVIVKGNIKFNNKDLLKLDITTRARSGIFMAYQHPLEIPGVNFRSYLRLAYNSGKDKSQQLPVFKFRDLLNKKAQLLGIDAKLLERNLNEGLSGGEKKKMEILQMAVLSPKLAILDETDSGLDIDALKIVFESIARLKQERKELSVLVITHYHKVFSYLKPHKVHVMMQGRIVKSGSVTILNQIEKHGYGVYK